MMSCLWPAWGRSGVQAVFLGTLVPGLVQAVRLTLWAGIAGCAAHLVGPGGWCRAEDVLVVSSQRRAPA
jgi:hypothetical protein